jgi:hypothetical protein
MLIEMIQQDTTHKTIAQLDFEIFQQGRAHNL